MSPAGRSRREGPSAATVASHRGEGPRGGCWGLEHSETEDAGNNSGPASHMEDGEENHVSRQPERKGSPDATFAIQTIILLETSHTLGGCIKGGCPEQTKSQQGAVGDVEVKDSPGKDITEILAGPPSSGEGRCLICDVHKAGTSKGQGRPVNSSDRGR